MASRLLRASYRMVKLMTEIELNEKITNLLSENPTQQKQSRRPYARENRVKKDDRLLRIIQRYYIPHAGYVDCGFDIRLCNRPFATIEEMDETLIRNWNAKVTNGDTVYILGDLLFRSEKPAEEYLKQLKGKKHLIIGNHDRDWVKKCNLKDFFESVNNLHFISDGKRQMTLCHYPMMSWPHMTRCYMVFGHIHGNTDADYWPLIRENDLMLNAGADVNGFAPVTFEEMQENNYRHKAGWNPELCTMEADQ